MMHGQQNIKNKTSFLTESKTRHYVRNQIKITDVKSHTRNFFFAEKSSHRLRCYRKL